MGIEWRKEMSVCNDRLDDDHKLLLDIVNQVEEALEKGAKGKRLLIHIDKLKRYTEEHFDREEQFLKTIQYPLYFDHKKEHIELISRLNDISASMLKLKGETAYEKAIPKFVDTLRDWLLVHILQEDMAYRDYLLDKQKSNAKK